jgi:hypothetical protein
MLPVNFDARSFGDVFVRQAQLFTTVQYVSKDQDMEAFIKH